MRHVGLGDQPDVGRHFVQHGADELYHPMRLRQVQARRADLLPQERNSIQSDEFSAASDVEQQDIQHLEQYVWVGVVQIDLVVAEGRPHPLRAGSRLHLGQQGQGARPHHRRQIGIPLDHDEVAAVARLIPQKALEPGALSRRVVDHGVEHQPEIVPEPRNVVPGAQDRIYRPIIHHREAVVRRVGIERQDVDAADHTAQVFAAEIGQGAQRGHPRLAHLVAVGDEDRVALGELTRPSSHGKQGEASGQPLVRCRRPSRVRKGRSDDPGSYLAQSCAINSNANAADQEKSVEPSPAPSRGS